MSNNSGNSNNKRNSINISGSINGSNNSTSHDSEEDILSIDESIKKKFSANREHLERYKTELSEKEDALTIPGISLRVKKTLEKNIASLKKLIQNLESNNTYHIYLAETAYIIEEYKKILKIPIKMSFMGSVKKDDSKKKEIIEKYIKIAQQYTDKNIQFQEEGGERSGTNSRANNAIACKDCGNSKDYEIEDGNIYICMNCFAQQNIIQHTSSYNDVDRINISSKYLYERKIHLRDCLKQYQGKQNSSIPDFVYKDLETQFERHHLLVGDKSTPNNIRFQNITKNHILMFLKEPLQYTKHYENVHLIHYVFTGIKPADVSHLEDILMDDFDQLIEKYNDQGLNGKNINTHIVLYQLLRRHKHPCKPEDFAVLKTIDRRCYHDDICKTIFEQLGWNYTPQY